MVGEDVSAMTAITVFIAEDHTLVREGTRQILEQQADLRVVGEAERGDDAVSQVVALRPDVALLDLRLPGLNGIAAAARIVADAPAVRVLLLSAYDDEDYVLAALRAGAAGYLLKTAPGRELVEAVRAAYAGETVLAPPLARKLAQYWQRAGRAGSTQLSPRELEVLRLLAGGCSNKDIAATLGISLRTVEGHLGNVFAKLGVGSRTEAVLYAVQHRLLSLEGGTLR
jgi:DNA-binding NarL/FixJ family response regulator